MLPSTLLNIVTDVRRAIEAQLYYPALTVALTLPDICVGLTLANDVFLKEKHYVDFVDKYAAANEASRLGLSGLDCYRLRGGMIHRGDAAGHHLFGSTHVVFTTPETQFSVHGISLEAPMQAPGQSAAMLDLVEFCETMISAVELWYSEHATNEMVKDKVSRLLSLRPNGVSPFIGGGPVVASG